MIIEIFSEFCFQGEDLTKYWFIVSFIFQIMKRLFFVNVHFVSCWCCVTTLVCLPTPKMYKSARKQDLLLHKMQQLEEVGLDLDHHFVPMICSNNLLVRWQTFLFLYFSVSIVRTSLMCPTTCLPACLVLYSYGVWPVWGARMNLFFYNGHELPVTKDDITLTL